MSIIQAALFAAAGGVMGAAALTPMQASLVSQGTIPDGDFFYLMQFAGSHPGETLHYTSTSDTQHWTAALTGSYFGSPLDVTYNGDLSGYPGGAITWTSTGSYGADPWSGSGALTITDHSGGFTTALQSSLQVGTNTGSMNVAIDASDDGSTIAYGGTTGDLSINGGPFNNPFGYTLLMKLSEGVYLDDFDLLAQDGSSLSPVLISIMGTFPNSPGGGMCASTVCQIDGTLAAVPEPATHFLIGGALLLACRWKRRKSMSD
jgi:hypothetical protein